VAFGSVATAVFPDVSGTISLYALAGMGATAAAVLGAPISTTLIVFELTGDWQTGLAVMTAVSLSTALASRLVERSFFLTQLARRGVYLAAGPEKWLLTTLSVRQTMRPVEEGEADTLWDLHGRGVWLSQTATLEQAMAVFERTGGTMLPVVEQGDEPKLIGVLHEVDALRAQIKALNAAAAEEHS
jgi:CIC family chloride channel protein